jgi:hypothetical protein
LAVDGEVFHLFREVPQADDIRFPGQHFLFHIHENTGQRLPGQAAAAQTDKVIAAKDVQHRGAVVHGVALHGQRLLLRLVAAQNKEQVAAILFVEIVPGGVFHRQMIGRDHDDRIFEIRRGFDFLNQCRDMLLTTGDRAKGEILFPADVIAFTLAGAGDKTVRMMGVDRQRKEREAFAGLRKFFEFFQVSSRTVSS